MATRCNPLPAGTDEVVRELRLRTVERGSMKRVAHELGENPFTLYNVRLGHRLPSDELAAKLGFRRVIRFERVK